MSSLEQLIEETALNLPDAADSIARQRLMKATESLAAIHGSKPFKSSYKHR